MSIEVPAAVKDLQDIRGKKDLSADKDQIKANKNSVIMKLFKVERENFQENKERVQLDESWLFALYQRNISFLFMRDILFSNIQLSALSQHTHTHTQTHKVFW